jgi:hypothetical protein
VLLDHVSSETIRAAQIVTGTTMAAFLLSPRLFPRHARQVRLGIATLYFAAVASFIILQLL